MKNHHRNLVLTFVMAVVFFSPQLTAHHGSAISYVRSDYFTRQFRAFEMSEHGIDGVD